jgi:Adenylate and Guanylate cyclase catalytic domain
MILKYRENEKLNQRIPNYKIKMGFGLHVGWAIEGPIGSEHKIDASYLSPNVNLASRLEAATKQYGVPLLLSSELYSLLSKKTRFFLRQIDHVTVKGSRTPIGLFTIDLDNEVLVPSQRKIGRKKNEKINHMMKKNYMMETALEEKYKVGNLFDLEEDLALMTAALHKENFANFRKIFNEGFNFYLKGEFKNALEYFKEGIKIKGSDDGPSKALIHFLEENLENLDNWKGYRELTEK